MRSCQRALQLVKAITSLINAAVATGSDGAKPKKGGAEKLKKCYDSFASLALVESHAQYYTAFQQSPAYTLITSRINDIVTSAASSAKLSLMKIVDEAEPMAGGGPAGELWKAQLAPGAKLKDVLHHVSDPTSVFMTEGDARSKIFDKVD